MSESLHFTRALLHTILDDKSNYGPFYRNFYQKRELLQKISACSIDSARRLEGYVLDATFDNIDYELTRFFDLIEKMKKEYEYVERRREGK